MTAAALLIDAARAEAALFGQPRGLRVLAGTGLWERNSAAADAA